MGRDKVPGHFARDPFRQTGERATVQLQVAAHFVEFECGLPHYLKILHVTFELLPGVAEKLRRLDLQLFICRFALIDLINKARQRLNRLIHGLLSNDVAGLAATSPSALGVPRLDPDSPAIIDSMGWVEYKLGNNEKAIEYLQRAWPIDRDPEIAAHLGEVYWVTGDEAAATDIWYESLQENPDSEALREVIDRFQPAP